MRNDRYTSALEDVKRILSELDAKRLSSSELGAAYPGKGFTAGWRFTIDFSDSRRRLDLLVESELPFAAPRIALVDRPPLLTWPHVEEYGLLCLLPGGAATSHCRTGVLVKRLIASAFELVTEGIRGENLDDLRKEFLSYWHRALPKDHTPYVSLIGAEPPSREISAWVGNEQIIVAEDHQAIDVWMNRRYGQAKKPRRYTRAGLIWLPEALVPSEYPSNSADLQELLSRCDANACRVIGDLAKVAPENIPLVIAMPTEHGPCFAGVLMRAPQSVRFVGGRRQPQLKGFRPGRAPEPMISTRYLSESTPVVRSAVARADAAWVHGRGHDGRHSLLSSARVLLIGCGSVGGFLAQLLATAGMGQLDIVDPQSFERANGGRHVLGAKHVDLNKAKATAAELQQNFPHLVVRGHASDWGHLIRHKADLLNSATLVIAATGLWEVNSSINYWQRRQEPRPQVLYGWTEPFSCAGHAVVLSGNGACFECGMSEFGRPLFRVTEWPASGTELQEPGCGTNFQPYGPIELSNVVTLLATAALDAVTGNVSGPNHYVSYCSEGFLQSCGGQWTGNWTEIGMSKSEYGGVLRREWRAGNGCDCREQ